MLNLTDIYNEYIPGSEGFAIAVETHCGFEMSREEIVRVGEAAPTAAEFERIWENETWWAEA